MKTGKNDWFRQATWDEDIEAFFNKKLKRCRSAWTKMQYLSIQGGLLMRQGKTAALREKGVELIKRLLDEFHETTQHRDYLVENQYYLGDYYWDQQQYDLAAYYYQKVVNDYTDPTRHAEGKRPGNIAQDADLKLAAVFLKTQQQDKIAAVFDLINNDPFWKQGEGLFFQFPHVRFNYPKTMALLCEQLGHPTEARRYAALALDVWKEATPMFDQQPSIGSIKTSEATIHHLKQLLL